MIPQGFENLNVSFKICEFVNLYRTVWDRKGERNSTYNESQSLFKIFLSQAVQPYAAHIRLFILSQP